MDENKNSAEIADAPHGVQQNIKMELLKWLNEGRDPFFIVGSLADYLEAESSEPGYAKTVKDTIKSVYGTGFAENAVLSDELMIVRSRLTRLREAIAKVSDDETQTRLKFAIEHHEKRISELEQQLNG